MDGMGKETIASYLQDSAKDAEHWQINRAKRAVRPYQCFKGLPEAPGEKKPALSAGGVLSVCRKRIRKGAPSPSPIVPDGAERSTLAESTRPQGEFYEHGS